MTRRLVPLTVALAGVVLDCSKEASSSSTSTSPSEPSAECQLVTNGFGPAGSVSVKADVVVSGLEVPWSIAFLPGGEMLVTERAGRVRLVRGGVLLPAPVVTVPTVQASESGLLGLAIDPSFASTRAFFLYYTVAPANAGGGTVNRIVRYVLDPSGVTAHEDHVLFDGIPAGALHDGGRLRIGPDGLLYAGTGDARVPDSAQDPNGSNGKLLRIGLDGAIPTTPPFPAHATYLLGIRNLEAFDWLDDGRLVVADHGPSGELGRSGHDEITIARAGDNLGWPETWSCDQAAGRVTPLIVWQDALPPGGGLFYRGDVVPGWRNSFLVGTLGSKHLHRVVFDSAFRRVVQHETYFVGDPPSGFGRLRDVVQGPDGAIYVATSNCDGRGVCPRAGDMILRIAPR